MAKKMSGKPSPEGHTSKSKIPFGDYYGTGVKNKIGRPIDVSSGEAPVPKGKLKTPPKKLA